MSEQYRAIYLGDDKWAVRHFTESGVKECQFIMHVADPQLRSSDKLAIEKAKTQGEWRKL